MTYIPIISFQNELDKADLPDKRLNTRLCNLFEKLSQSPTASIPAALNGHADIKGAYRFFSNRDVLVEDILQPHYQRTLERIQSTDTILLINDTTDLSLKHMKKVEDLGVITIANQPGCQLHALIAFTIDRICLGTLSATFLHRKPEELGKKTPHDQRFIEDKESYRWIEDYRKACRLAKEMNKHVIYIADQESEIYTLFVEYALCESPAHFVIRSAGSRSIRLNDGSQILLKKAMEKAPIIGKIEFLLPSSRGRKNRETRRKRKDEITHRNERWVTQHVRSLEVKIKPPKGKKTQHKLEVKVQALYLEEIDCPAGEKPVNWLLLTSLPTKEFTDVKKVINYYLARWAIEVFFHILKNGCQIEKLQFETRDRFLKCVALYLVVTWRTMHIMMLSRNMPHLTCDIIFETNEWECAYALVHKKPPPKQAFDLGTMLKLIAQLGGHLGRVKDSPPGPRIIWKGLQKIYYCAEGWRACKEMMSSKSYG